MSFSLECPAIATWPPGAGGGGTSILASSQWVVIRVIEMKMDVLARIILGLTIATLAGCAMAREPSKTPRTAVEQLLLAHAVERSLYDLTLPISKGAPVALEVAGFSDYLPFQTATQSTNVGTIQQANGTVYGSRSDLLYVRDVVAGRLGELGYRVQDRRQDARYLIKILVQALGTEQGETFFGMPSVQSVLIPFALPELTVFRAQDQKAYMRYSLDMYEIPSGRFIRSTPWHLGTAYYQQYTVLFFVRFKRTDLPFSP